MIPADRMAAVDANAAALGVPRKQLMESSGNAVARVAREMVDGEATVADEGASITLLAGRGNNGGDTHVAARFLSEHDVTVLLLGRPETITTDIARENWDALQEAELEARTVTDSRDLRDDDGPDHPAIADADLLVDGLLGTGVTGALREPEATAARALNAAAAPVLAVDVPSGVDADTGTVGGTEAGGTDAVAVAADRVVTFHDAKPGLADLDCEVTVADIGIPDAAELFVGPGDLLALGRDPTSHKGDHGEVLVVGGGPYTGAPALAAQAALRGGADLVRVACPDSVAREVQGYSENLIVRPLPGDHLAPEHGDRLLDLAADHDVVVLGPGLGDRAATSEAVRDFVAAFDGTGLVDADALAEVPAVDTEATLVCTPHQGELREMGGPAAEDWRERADAVETFAAELGHVLLVKGAYDVVSDGETTRVNRTGNPGMTVGGTGDVLAGMTGALLATQPPVDAAAIGAHVNGRAGDRVVGEAGGYGMTATDLLDELPAAAWGGRDG